jgi:hypothetical protein
MGTTNPIKPAYVAVGGHGGTRRCRGGTHGGRWSRGGGRGQGRGSPSANVASTEEAPFVTLTGEQLKM